MGIVRAVVLLWLLRQALRLARVLTVVAVLVVLWPVTVTALLAGGAAWLAGWPPARLYRAAAWAAPMAGVWLVAVALAPVNLWHQASLWIVHGHVLGNQLGRDLGIDERGLRIFGRRGWLIRIEPGGDRTAAARRAQFRGRTGRR